MAGTTLGILSEILKDYFLGPPRFEAVTIKVWTCSKHKHPVHDQYEDVCLAAEALGTECEDLYECPHVVSRKIKTGCSECKTSRYAEVLDYETVKMDESGFVYGDPVYEVRLFTTMAWELEKESILFNLLAKEANG